ncbi:hypothetical protein ACFL3G_03635 [Planctomycetota bacterium]
MSKKIVMIVIAVMLMATLLQAQDEELGFTYDLQYHSKWLSKGVEAYGQQGAIFNKIDVDLYGSGWGVIVVHRNAISDGYVDSQRFDYRPYYKSQVFQEESYATNYNISVGYEHYYGRTRHKANTTWEWVGAFSWPNILKSGIVPSYIVHYETPVSGGDANRKVAGWMHRFRLGYDLQAPELTVQPLHLSAELAYDDGFGAGSDHDWSYATFGVSTKFKITENLSFIPGLYQQISMEDTTATRKDITYTILTMKYKF